MRRQVICAVEDGALADLLCRRLSSTPDKPGRRIELDTGDTGAGTVASARTVEPAPAGVLTRGSDLRIAG